MSSTSHNPISPAGCGCPIHQVTATSECVTAVYDHIMLSQQRISRINNPIFLILLVAASVLLRAGCRCRLAHSSPYGRTVRLMKPIFPSSLPPLCVVGLSGPDSRRPVVEVSVFSVLFCHVLRGSFCTLAGRETLYRFNELYLHRCCVTNWWIYAYCQR